VRDNQNGLFNDHLYFVTKPGQDTYVSGGGDLLTEIDDIGWDYVQERMKIAQGTPSPIAAPAPTLTPTPMSAADRKQMEEGWKQFREKEKAEEQKRKQALDKAAREARGDSEGTIGETP
jgi:hypothetical protein